MCVSESNANVFDCVDVIEIFQSDPNEEQVIKHSAWWISLFGCWAYV